MLEPKSTLPATPTDSRYTEIVQSKFSLIGLAAISFIEAALPVPIITDPFLVASILVNRAQALKLVVVTTIASVLGGILAYYFAYFAFDLLENLFSPEVMSEVNVLIETNTTNTLALTLIGAVTPVPYTFVAWVVGALKANILIFIVGSIVGRGARYMIVGYCSYRFGPLAVSYARRYIALASIIVAVVVGVIVWLKM